MKNFLLATFKFEVGKWVAYETKEDIYIYAKIFYKVSESSGNTGSVTQRSKYLIDFGEEKPIN